MAKTQVFDGTAHIEGTISMRNQDVLAGISLPTKVVAVGAGGIYCVLRDVSTETALWNGYPNWENGHDFAVAIFIGFAYDTPTSGVNFVFFDTGDPTPWEVSVDYDFSISGNQLYRNETQNPRDSRTNVCYADEVKYTDSWTAIHPIIWSVTFGSLTYSGTQVWDPLLPGWTPELIGPIVNFSFYFDQHKGTGSTRYADADAAWDGVDVNFSRYEKDKGDWKLTGDGNAVLVDMINTNPGLNDSQAIIHPRPYILDFSEFYVRDRDGVYINDLCVSGPFQASNHYPPSLDWSTTPDGQTTGSASPGDTVYPTVREVRAIGEYVVVPSITGMDYKDPDDQYKLITSNTLRFSLTSESIEYYT